MSSIRIVSEKSPSYTESRISIVPLEKPISLHMVSAALSSKKSSQTVPQTEPSLKLTSRRPSDIEVELHEPEVHEFGAIRNVGEDL